MSCKFGFFRQAALAIAACVGVAAHAVPILQIGVPNGLGGYVPYTDVAPDADTAYTSGSALAAGGVYQKSDVVQVGGKYGGTCSSGCLDWSAVSYGGGQFFDSSFNGKGAVVMVSVAEGSLVNASANLRINGLSAFATSTAAFWGDNHFPVKDNTADFLYFDIGNFSKNLNAVSDFATGSGVGTADGEVKALALTLNAFAGDWAHFDLMALVTEVDERDVREKGQIVGKTYLGGTDNAESPNSHDVTWTRDGGGGGGGGGGNVPEPGSLALVALALIGAGAMRRRAA